MVRLERLEDLNQKYNLDRLLIEEAEYMHGLGAWKFIQLLTKGNNQGLSPLQEAASSKHLFEFSNDQRVVLSNHLSENVLSKLFSAPIPPQNRGLAYKAFEMSVGNYSWPWRTAFDAMIFVVTPAGAALGAYVTGDGTLIGGIGGAVAVFACAAVFKNSFNLRKAKKLLSPLGVVRKL